MALFKSKQARLDEQLFEAIHKNEVGAATLLLQKGASANAVDDDGNSPLIIVSNTRICGMEMVDLLLAHGADPHFVSGGTGAPLVWAAYRNKVEAVEKYISLGVNIEFRSYSGNTALHLAAINDCPEVLQVLLNAGADTMALNDKNQTPLYMAQRHNKLHIVDLLKAHQASLAKKSVVHDDVQWLKTGESEIARISQNAVLEYQVTEVFNFSARKCTQIMRNLKTDAESQAIVFFDAYADKRLLVEARNELLQQNGTADEDSVRNVLIFKPAARN